VFDFFFAVFVITFITPPDLTNLETLNFTPRLCRSSVAQFLS
jgi:hypothetical protein